ncbi:YigZ family protein [Christensenellaceae bacterium]|nr:YigZ family protein [Christensenellaceae bacterium]BDF62237.1 YigZ family protein [Christensenellaceae bacterium]
MSLNDMELKEYTCLAKRSESETVIKKSRFICALIPVESERQAAEELLKVRKKHYNATHNCSAMILKADASFEKSSDDGEPQGTAGLPMLEVLRHSGLTNILAVVTRYFGGTLLGAGGLARAYGASVTRSLSEAKKVRMIPAIELGFTVEYADYSKLQSIAGEYGAQVTAEFTDKVDARMVVRQAVFAQAEKKIREAFFGADVMRVLGERYITKTVGF